MSEAHGESHMPTYKKVIAALAVMTGIEFGIAMGMKGGFPPFVLGVLLLVGLAFWKAALVARFFMHVKYDKGIFAFLAVLPVILAAPLILLVLFDLTNGPNIIVQ